ncbi:hypothetical protein [Microbacterium sp. LWH3-1.2]
MTRAALYDSIGSPDVLYVGEVADAEPGPGEVDPTRPRSRTESLLAA